MHETDLDQLQDRVNELMEDEFYPFQGVTVKDGHYYQVMVRLPEDFSAHIWEHFTESKGVFTVSTKNENVQLFKADAFIPVLEELNVDGGKIVESEEEEDDDE